MTSSTKTFLALYTMMVSTGVEMKWLDLKKKKETKRQKYLKRCAIKEMKRTLPTKN